MGVKLYNEEDVQDIAKVVRYGTEGTMRVEEMPSKIFDAMASTTSTTDTTEAYEKVMPNSVCGKVGVIYGKSVVEDGTIKSYPTTELVVSGKNLFDIANPQYSASSVPNLNYKPEIENEIIYSGGLNGAYSGAFLVVPCNQNTSYTFSFDVDVSGNFQINGFENVGLSTNTAVLSSGSLSVGTISKTINSGNYSYIGIAFWNATKYGVQMTNLQIEQGSTSTSYSPYKAPQTISLSQWNGYSAGSVADEYGEGVVTNRIGKRAFHSGDENDSSVITDMTNTLYVLDTPIITSVPQIPIFDAEQNGSVRFVTDSDTKMPIKSQVTYINRSN